MPWACGVISGNRVVMTSRVIAKACGRWRALARAGSFASLRMTQNGMTQNERDAREGWGEIFTHRRPYGRKVYTVVAHFFWHRVCIVRLECRWHLQFYSEHRAVLFGIAITFAGGRYYETTCTYVGCRRIRIADVASSSACGKLVGYEQRRQRD